MAMLEVKDLSFSYPEANKKSLDGISFCVERGEFITICGATGSGKSTLMRMLKRELRPLGHLTGSVFYEGIELDNLSDLKSVSSIGYVMQRPEQQIVTDKVWHELAFGLENLGLPNGVIRRRVSEMASYFGIEDWFERDTASLSGGQKQLLNLASVMVMQPDILLLDEPTAQLDPIAASDFINTVSRLNRDFSLTILIIEHQLENVLPVSDKVLVLDSGRVFTFSPVQEAVKQMCERADMRFGLTASARVYANTPIGSVTPITIREGRNYISSFFRNDIVSLSPLTHSEHLSKALEFDNIYFRYKKDFPDVLNNLNFSVYENEIFCVLGGNGSGKSTTLSAAAGLLKPYCGNIRVFGKKLKEYKNQSLYRNCLAMLPQDVQTLFLRNTVREELAEADMASFPFDLSDLLDKHPYDLSGGQQQLVALAKVLTTSPRLLLMDEPSKGLDAYAKDLLINVLKKLRASGMTIVCVTHDVEFAAGLADRCAMFFRGEITSCDYTREFFCGNSFYTTSANRLSRGIFEGVTTVDELNELICLNGRRVQ